MSRKRLTLVLCLILVVAVLGFSVWFVKYRTAERAATPAEMEAHSAYFVDWHRVSCWQEGMTEQKLILSLCTVDPENEDAAVVYTSETLGEMLYRCETVEEICLSEGVLTIHYRTADDERVTLRYPENGSACLWVWDQDKDTLYTQTEDGAVVTTNYYRSLRRRVQ